MPPNTRSVARPGKFGNRVVTVEEAGSNAAAVEAYRAWAMAPEQAEFRGMARQELRGMNLACWCKAGLPCHADVLLAIANGFAGLEQAQVFLRASMRDQEQP
jgi:hypothetical protein